MSRSTTRLTRGIYTFDSKEAGKQAFSLTRQVKSQLSLTSVSLAASALLVLAASDLLVSTVAAAV